MYSMKKEFFIWFLPFIISINSNSQNNSNINNTHFKIYNIGNYKIKYAVGAKLDWGEVFDLAKKSEKTKTDEWRLPTIEELREIYFFRQNLVETKGIFWSSTIGFPLRMGLISCIDFTKGEEFLINEGKNYYILINHQQ